MRKKTQTTLNPSLFAQPGTVKRLYLVGIVAGRTPEALFKERCRRFPKLSQKEGPARHFAHYKAVAKRRGLIS